MQEGQDFTILEQNKGIQTCCQAWNGERQVKVKGKAQLFQYFGFQMLNYDLVCGLTGRIDFKTFIFKFFLMKQECGRALFHGTQTTLQAMVWSQIRSTFHNSCDSTCTQSISEAQALLRRKNSISCFQIAVLIYTYIIFVPTQLIV